MGAGLLGWTRKINMLDAKLVRFLIVGMANTLIGLLIIYAAKVMGAGDVVANGVGYAAGIAIGFYLNKQWTFAYSHRALPAFFRFLLVTGAAYTANLGVVLLAINGLAYNAYVAQALGIPVYTLINYLGSRYFTFREAEDPSTEAAGVGGNARDAGFKGRKHVMLTSRFRKTALVSCLLLLLVPVIFYFWVSLAGLHAVIRYAAVVLCAFILGFGCYLLQAYIAQLRRVGIAICLTLFFVGVLVAGNRADTFPSPFDVQLFDRSSDGIERLNPILTNVWGKSLWVYSVAPKKGGQTALALRFPYALSQVRLFLTGDPGSWKNASIQGGHSLVIEVASARDGSHSAQHVVTVPVNDLSGGSWIIKSLPLAANSSGEVRVTMKLLGPNGDMSGPPVVMAVQAYGALAWLSAAGKALLTGLALGVLGLSFASTTQPRTLTANPYRPRLLSWPNLYRLGASALFVLFLGGFVYWSSVNSNYVFFWDYRNYWSLTEQLFEKMAAGNWTQALNAFITAYPADYSMLPAVIPAFFSLAIGYPHKTVYAVLIAVVYAAPAFLMMAYCAERLTSPAGTFAMPSARAGFVPSASVVLIGYPAFLGVVLLMMPDIGGVVLVGAAMLLAHELTMRLVTPEKGEGPWYLSTGFIKVCLALGVLLAMMFLFRRWYIFSAAGIAFATSCISAYHILTAGPRRRVAVARAFAGFALVAMASMLLLAPVIFDWASSISQHNYGTLYSSYRRPPRSDLAFFLSTFGLIMPCLVLALLGAARWLKLQRDFLFIVVLSTCISGLLFYLVQSPGAQHFYLLMPLLGICLAASVQLLWLRLGRRASAVLFSVGLAAGIAMVKSWPVVGPSVTAYFPGYQSWAPKHQAGAGGLIALSLWLLEPSSKQRTVCLVGSSSLINESILSESWQIVPTAPKYPFAGRLLNQSQVDSVNGPPSESIRRCDIALVAMPLQTHLERGQQDTVRILQEEITGHFGVGVHYQEMPKRFPLANGVEVIPYQRVSDITLADYDALVKRYLQMKASEATPGTDRTP